MIRKKTWNDFYKTGLLLIINQILHIFGWAIVVNFDKKKEKIIECYPARVKFRGFDNKSVGENYIKLSEYMNNNSEELLKEVNE